MNIQELKNLKGRNKVLCTSLIIVLILFLVALIFSTSVNVINKIKEGKYIGKVPEIRNTITVSETGEVYAKPDLAITTLSIVIEAKTVNEALNENTERMNAIISFVKNQGIEDKDLKTISFNIYPLYEWYEKDECPYPCPPGQRVLVGYEVHQSLQVKIRNMEKIGQIIEGAIDAGANQIGDLYFTIDKEEELKKQARDQAIEKAKQKAKDLTSQLGVNLVKIISFSESGIIPYYYDYATEREIGLGGGETLQIETGENKIQVTVSITYEID